MQTAAKAGLVFGMWLLGTVGAASQQIDCQRLANGLASRGIYTDEQKEEMQEVYRRECSQSDSVEPPEPEEPAEPPSLLFTIRNSTGVDLEVSFKSEARDAWWPGDGKVYILNNGKVGSYKLSCVAGERICYGASKHFFIERYWGAGANHQYSCTDCCYICGPGATTGGIGLSP